MRRMEKVTGRSDDMLIVRGVNVFPTQIEEQITKIGALSPHWQIERVKEGNMEGLKVHCEARPSAASEEERQAAAKSLQKLVKDIIGITVAATVHEPGGVARSEGKAQRVVDNR